MLKNLAAALLLTTALTAPAAADMFQNAGNAKLPDALINLGLNANLYAVNYGLKADGLTSDDLALKAAVDACNTAKTRLVLPYGNILLTGAATITITGCNLTGAGVTPGGGQIKGTTIHLTSTTVQPFVLGAGGIGLEGINFYYPNQTGAVVYPPLFTDTAAGVNALYWNNINILNAYDGFKQSASSGGLGGWFISNSSMYATHDMFSISSVGDYVFISNSRFNQGVWQQVAGGNAWFFPAIDLLAKSNTIFHIVTPTTETKTTLKLSNVSAFAWGTGIKVEAGGVLSFGDFDWSVDGMGTVVDTTSGGSLANFTMRCNNCAVGVVDLTHGIGTSGNGTAFKLGTTGDFALSNSNFNPMQGSVVETSGTTVFLNNNRIAFGAVRDGNDYYVVKVLAGHAHVDMRNNFFSGDNTSTKTHGLKTIDFLQGFAVQNNRFLYLNDVMDVVLGDQKQLFTGNEAELSTGTQSINTTQGTPDGRLLYGNNYIDNWPVPVVSNCGAGAVLGGGSKLNHGFIQAGTTVPTTSCKLTFPFNVPGSVNCVFQTPVYSAQQTLSASSLGTPSAWTITTLGSFATTQIHYVCGFDG